MKTSARVDAITARRVDHLLGAIEQAEIELPALTDAVATEARLAGWLDETRDQARATKTGHLLTMTAEAVVAAARSGEKRPAAFVAAILEAEERERVLALEERVLAAAHDAAAIALVRLVAGVDLAPLREAHDGILGRARELAPTLQGLDPDDPEAILAAPAKTQAARAELLALSRRHAALREAWAVVVGEDTARSDYGRLRHPERAWGTSWRGRRQTPARPWPTTPLAYLLWLSGTDAAPWLPSPADVAAREADERAQSKARTQGATFGTV